MGFKRIVYETAVEYLDNVRGLILTLLKLFFLLYGNSDRLRCCFVHFVLTPKKTTFFENLLQRFLKMKSSIIIIFFNFLLYN